ncbi:MAG: 50S ribosomal protein L19 [Rickettsiaceae bacterium H1]|nr:50S ribosomal protein L19 [Rickettsiaceae bacterium H1]
MFNLLEEYNNEQMKKLSEGKQIIDFRAGDTLELVLRVAYGENERLQRFTGLCIARKNRGLHSSFILRKVDKNGGAVERLFPLYSPVIKEMKVIRYGAVRRAKIYYIRNLFGKAARIKERKKIQNKS